MEVNHPSAFGLVTTKELSEMLDRPENTLRFWRHTGVGPRSAKVGGRVMYRLQDVQAWIDAQFEAEGA